MPGWISPWELLILVFVVLLIFGPKRVPEAGRSLGRGLREFKEGIMGGHDDKPELPVTAPPETTVAGASREHDTV
jgi:sec-independent protein translocase protein TatA